VREDEQKKKADGLKQTLKHFSARTSVDSLNMIKSNTEVEST
jgi:hypothetical protein